MKSQEPNENYPSLQKLTAWERECAAAYEELVKAGICLPEKDGIWQFAPEYMHLATPEHAQRAEQRLKEFLSTPEGARQREELIQKLLAG